MDSCAVFFQKLLFFFQFNEIKCNFYFIYFFPILGSADRTVKFWDLETFELIGSAGPEVLSIIAIYLFSPG